MLPWLRQRRPCFLRHTSLGQNQHVEKTQRLRSTLPKDVSRTDRVLLAAPPLRPLSLQS